MLVNREFTGIFLLGIIFQIKGADSDAYRKKDMGIIKERKGRLQNMKINRMSLLNSLFSIMNEGCEEDSGYILARYFLEHYSELGSANIYDVAADCFVSRSSVRRFCRLIGYDNFLELKKDFKEYNHLYSRFVTHADCENYRTILTNEIENMIKELDKRMNNEETIRIVERIHDSNKVVFLATDTSASFIKQFQQSMIFGGKIIYLISNDFGNNSLLSKMEKEDYLVTVSASGTFAAASLDYIAGCKAFKSLITVNRDALFKEHYDKVYHLSANNHTQEAFSVYGSYGISYMLDIIFSQYIYRYKNKAY